ncbi:MAG: YqaJ viral recombinase family protein [Pseudomonadales bacterium]|nr:YqaJ viral recombinase family protein [Pseudomonadales bacterium]
MSKMKTVDLNQRSDKWLQWRSQGITASDIPIILGLSPYKTPWQLWAEKVGRINAPDISNNPNVKRGVRLEDEARQMAESRYGEVLLPICGECARWDVLRASFDGLDSNMEPYEFKAPSESVWEDIGKNGIESGTYKLYEAQVHAQCVVAGAKTGRLIFYKEDGQDLDFPVTLTLERENEILEAAKLFWEHVITNTPPEPDPERDWYIPESGDQQFKWDAYADAWCSQNHRIQALKDELKALDKEQKGIQKAMITLMGPFMQADMGGVKVSRFKKKGSIDYMAYLNETFPDKDLTDELESYRKASREESRFSRSEDELVNADVSDVVTLVKPAYF